MFYASGPATLIHAVLAPLKQVTPADQKDLMHAFMQPDESWAIQKSYGGGEGHGDAAGKGKGEGTGGGAGGGIGVEPIGFLTTRGDQISFIPTRASKGLSAVFEKVPDLLEKMMDKKKAQKAEATF